MDGNKKYMSLRDRMLIVFLIAGIIPFIIVIIYTNSETRNIMTGINKSAREDELSLMASAIDSNIQTIQDLGRELEENDNLVRLLKEKDKIGNPQDIKRYFDAAKLLSYYESSVSGLWIYMEDPGDMEGDLFVKVDENISDESWYKKSIEQESGMYWFFTRDSEQEQRKLQASMPIRDNAGKLLAVAVVCMKNSVIQEIISKRAVNTVLFYNDSDIIYTSYEYDSTYGLLRSVLKDQNESSNTVITTQVVQDYLVSYQKIFPNNNGDHYTIACIESYKSVNGQINNMSVWGCVALAAGGFLYLIMVMEVFGDFSSRMKKLRHQMHLVARGRYDEVRPIRGRDEIAEIYSDLERMKGDIQELTQRMVEEKVQKEKLHTHQKEVEFKMLASQINPHFLYNTLETIRMKAVVNGQKEIEELVKMLAMIMRRNISVKYQMVSLRSEIELTENYLKIQNYRFGDRIHADVEVDKGIDMDMEVMPLVVQPFVENAYVHGLEEKSEGGLLKVTVSRDDQNIIITVRDNGVGMKYYELAELKHKLGMEENTEQNHIGIYNVNKRLKLQYGEDYGVEIDSREGKGTVVSVKIPKNYS